MTLAKALLVDEDRSRLTSLGKDWANGVLVDTEMDRRVLISRLSMVSGTILEVGKRLTEVTSDMAGCGVCIRGGVLNSSLGDASAVGDTDIVLFSIIYSLWENSGLYSLSGVRPPRTMNVQPVPTMTW